MIKQKDRPKTGDKCKLCGNGRVALVSAYIQDGVTDPEPYTSGVEEGEEITIEFEDLITFVIHACDNCGHVYSILIE